MNLPPITPYDERELKDLVIVCELNIKFNNNSNKALRTGLRCMKQRVKGFYSHEFIAALLSKQYSLGEFLVQRRLMEELCNKDKRKRIGKFNKELSERLETI